MLTIVRLDAVGLFTVTNELIVLVLLACATRNARIFLQTRITPYTVHFDGMSDFHVRKSYRMLVNHQIANATAETLRFQTSLSRFSLRKTTQTTDIVFLADLQHTAAFTRKCSAVHRFINDQLKMEI